MIEYILKSIPHGGNFFFLSSGIPIICDFKQAPRLAIPEHTTQVGSRRCPRHPPHSFFLIFFFFYVGSSRTRARTRVPFISRWILNHCATREAPSSFFFLPGAKALMFSGWAEKVPEDMGKGLGMTGLATSIIFPKLKSYSEAKKFILNE